MFFSQALNCSRADENSYIKICTFFCSFPIVMMGKLQHDNVIDILQNIREILSKWNLTIDLWLTKAGPHVLKCAFLRIHTGHA